LKLSDRAIRFGLKPAVFIASVAPAVYLTWAAFAGQLSADPLAEYRNETGAWTLRFLCLSLAVTPFRRLTGWNPAIKFRRMLGLYAFFYGSLHFFSYLIFDRFAALDFTNALSPDGSLRWTRLISWTMLRGLAASIWDDVYKRAYITVGFLAYVLMVPLAITSTAGMIRRLGRRWQTLHRLVYVSAVAGVVHYWWLVKRDIRDPFLYGVVVALLLGFRVYWTKRKTSKSAVGRSPQRRPA
jgi:sulfoxide reductase heme-binding subunit YedZ